VASFVVDVYYNHLYMEAKKLHATGKIESITEGYKCAMSMYISSLTHPEHYKKTIVGVHRYYSTTTRFTHISFAECMNNISKQFMPEDLFDSMSESQKDGMIRVILTSAIKQFSSEILKGPLLRMIIDEHDRNDIIRILQDCMVECLIFEREKMYQKIFSSQNNTSQDAEISVKMRKLIEKLVKENKKLKDRERVLKQYIQKCTELLHRQKEIITSKAEKPASEQPYSAPRSVSFGAYAPVIQDNSFRRHAVGQRDVEGRREAVRHREADGQREVVEQLHAVQHEEELPILQINPVVDISSENLSTFYEAVETNDMSNFLDIS